MTDIYDISGTNRSLKIPLGLKPIHPKKYCVNHSKIERDARKRVRTINKYQRTIARNVSRSLKDMNNVWMNDE
jgi:hypothetical protein